MKNARFHRIVITICLGLVSVAASAQSSGEPVTVQTNQGAVIGRATAIGRQFRGIPYAAAPVGELRFRPPQDAASWTSPRMAQQFGSICPQPKNFANVTAPENTVTGDEDCLYLNVDTPRDGFGKLPVAVWIHGGVYTIGAASYYDPSVLAAKNNLVTVTLNYRLGALGFLNNPALAREGSGGNLGLMDQQFALKWVQKNIAAFGGDPNNITIFGQAAGGNSVCEQLVSPTAKGLFQHAIIQSGVCGAPGSGVSLSAALASGNEYARKLGCHEGDIAKCLRRIPAEKLVKTESARHGLIGPNSWGPVYGDAVIPTEFTQALRDGHFLHVPVINGSNHDEGNLFALQKAQTGVPYPEADYLKDLDRLFGANAKAVGTEYPAAHFTSPLAAYAAVVTDGIFACPALRTNRALASQTATYAYEYSDPNAISKFHHFDSVGAMGAYNASELTSIFQTRSQVANPFGFSSSQRILADRMMSHWASFIRDGQPNDRAGLKWARFEPGNEDIEEFKPGPPSTVKHFERDHDCDFWAKLVF